MFHGGKAQCDGGGGIMGAEARQEGEHHGVGQTEAENSLKK